MSWNPIRDNRKARRAKRKARHAAQADWARYIRDIRLSNERHEADSRRDAQAAQRRVGFRTVGGPQNSIGGAFAADGLPEDVVAGAPRNRRARVVRFDAKVVDPMAALTPTQQALVTLAQSGFSFNIGSFGGMR